MPSRPPVILAYYAQSKDGTHLNYLRSEYDQICEQWRKADTNQNNPINIQYLPNRKDVVDPEYIRKDIVDYNERVLIFHFSGHTGSDAIFLTGAVGRADGLAGLLAQNARNLKLVFLNGCANEKQVDVLFANNIPVVIATQCKVGDKIATEFSRCFYEALSTYGNTIQSAYTAAFNAVRFNGEVAGSLPPNARQLAESYDINQRGNLETETQTENIWVLYVRSGDEAVVHNPDWWQLPDMVKQASDTISLERAYTCNRKANALVFRQFFDPYGRTAAVQHYLVADQKNVSPLGLSSKLVYERITRDMQRNRNSCFFPDPNVLTFTDDFVELDSPMAYEEIASKIFDKLVSKFPNGPKATWSDFKDFYDLNVARNREYLIVFIKIQEPDLPTLITGISTFITSSIGYAATNPNSRPRLLFFWHILIKPPERNPFSRLLWWVGNTNKQRESCLQRFADLCKPGDPATSQVWIINQNSESLSRPEEDDIEEWLQLSLISPQGRLNELVDVANDDVANLELEFRALIEEKRTKEAALRL
ncbi:hypothetical protein GO730_27675 [Spirosoma sp. HMF3257]|uniref:CHAT domain-containing protein n=1 Tax=Spirosoma telluris TaxID=2183553 RepID=A0A327NT71_9BACT|nr:hypothetical protein [Spirosoma telluris]RAI77004.1 hypothetical protein HMF3257_27605 [Spirosoma telluris]